MSIGDKIREARKAAGLTQFDLSKKTSLIIFIITEVTTNCKQFHTGLWQDDSFSNRKRFLHKFPFSGHAMDSILN